MNEWERKLVEAWAKEYGLPPEAVEANFQASVENAQQLRRLRELLREAVILFESDDECSDPSTDEWGWLQAVRTELEGVRA